MNHMLPKITLDNILFKNNPTFFKEEM